MMTMIKMVMIAITKVVIIMIVLDTMVMTLTSNDDAANFAFSS